jgi:hypothetical protein
MRIVGTPLSLARVAELADAYGSGPYGATRGGSSPLASSLVNRRARSVDLDVGRYDVRANGSDRRHAALRPVSTRRPRVHWRIAQRCTAQGRPRQRPLVSSSGDVA